ncbi:MAG: RHS repeat domain-containing protein [Terriglobia bacterium]
MRSSAPESRRAKEQHVCATHVDGYWYQDNLNTSFSHTASYNFDNVNRLTAAVATGNSTYNQSYSYTADGSTGQYGNMTCTSGCANMPANLAFSANTNQITSANYTYDAAGNLTKDSSNATAHTYQWDAEGRVSKVDSGTTWSFTYNAVGNRVAWVSGGVTYDHLFDPAGNWLGVAGSYSIIMQGGRPLVVYNSAETWFHHVNNIGSRTFMTNHYGTPTQDMTFYPWGDLWQSWGGGGLEFADLPYRDPNTTTDLTTYRLFSPNIGRWHSPDPLGGDITNPQTLNRYAYVLNNPTTLIDPMGLQGCDPATIGTADCTPEEASQSNPPGGGGGGGWDTDPSDFPCAYTNSVDASCGQPPGLWSNGEPIEMGGWGGSLPQPSPSGGGGGTAGGAMPGIPGGFQYAGTDVLDYWPFIFRVTSWGWPYILRGVAAVGSVPAALPAILAGVLFMESDAPPSVRAAARASSKGLPTIGELQASCTPGRRVVEPSRSRPGWTSEEQEYICNGDSYTVHCLVSPTGASRDCHVRPGSPKGGGGSE